MPAPVAPRAPVPAGWPPASNPPGGYLAPFTVDFPFGDLAAFPVGRDIAWQVPAVAQGVQTIAGTLGALPVVRYREVTDDAGVIVRLERLPQTAFLRQPDPAEPRETTLTRVVEDLVFFPAAYLVILRRDAAGFPMEARYVLAETVEPRASRGADGYQVDLDWWPASEVIVFTSHWPGLLTAGASAVRTAALLERAARRYANDNAPAGALKNRGADLPPDKIDELLTNWETARARRTTGYLNGQVDYERYSWNSAEIELVPSRQWQASEIARHLNLPPRYVNAPAGASMDYANITSERRDLVDLSLAPYIATVQGRLSMADITPRGQVVRLDLSDFYAGDFQQQVTTYAAAIAAGILTTAEARTLLRLPPTTGN